MKVFILILIANRLNSFMKGNTKGNGKLIVG